MSKSRISRDIKTLFYFSVTCYKKRVMKKSNNDFNFRNQSNRSLFIAGGGTDFFLGGGGNGGGSLEYYRASGGKFYCDRTKILRVPSLSSTLPPLSGINVDRCLNDNERGSVSL